jgi:hypothetical protein
MHRKKPNTSNLPFQKSACHAEKDKHFFKQEMKQLLKETVPRDFRLQYMDHFSPGAWGKMIHEKNMKQKISCHCPFKYKPLNTITGGKSTRGKYTGDITQGFM